MDLSLLADEVWAASKEVQARAHNLPTGDQRDHMLEAHYNLSDAVHHLQVAIGEIKRACDD